MYYDGLAQYLVIFSVVQYSLSCHCVGWLTVYRTQEEESLQAAIALSKQETQEGGGEEEEPATNGSSNDLLLDFDSSGK